MPDNSAVKLANRAAQRPETTAQPNRRGSSNAVSSSPNSYDTSEQELTDTLIGELAPGTLNLADRRLRAG